MQVLALCYCGAGQRTWRARASARYFPPFPYLHFPSWETLTGIFSYSGNGVNRFASDCMANSTQKIHEHLALPYSTHISRPLAQRQFFRAGAFVYVSSGRGPRSHLSLEADVGLSRPDTSELKVNMQVGRYCGLTECSTVL